jgi:hypothetical protein
MRNMAGPRWRDMRQWYGEIIVPRFVKSGDDAFFQHRVFHFRSERGVVD